VNTGFPSIQPLHNTNHRGFTAETGDSNVTTEPGTNTAALIANDESDNSTAISSDPIIVSFLLYAGIVPKAAAVVDNRVAFLFLGREYRQAKELLASEDTTVHPRRFAETMLLLHRNFFCVRFRREIEGAGGTLEFPDGFKPNRTPTPIQPIDRGDE